MAEYNKDESLIENAMRGVDITMPDLPNEIDLDEMPEEIEDAVYEHLQEYFGRELGKYAKSYDIDVKVTNIEWEDL